MRRRRGGGQPRILAKRTSAAASPPSAARLTLLDQPFTVVGVTPPSFTGLEVGETFDVALPLVLGGTRGTRVSSGGIAGG